MNWHGRCYVDFCNHQAVGITMRKMLEILSQNYASVVVFYRIDHGRSLNISDLFALQLSCCQVDENMVSAQQRDAARQGKFFFRKTLKKCKWIRLPAGILLFLVVIWCCTALNCVSQGNYVEERSPGSSL